MRINGKNIMKTPEEKERIVLEYMNGNISTRAIAEKYGTTQGVINKWLKSYRVLGIKRLISNTGKLGQRKGNFKKTEIEQLKYESLNGWIKEELFIDFDLKQCNNVLDLIQLYINYYNNERPSYALNYKTPIQYKIESGF